MKNTLIASIAGLAFGISSADAAQIRQVSFTHEGQKIIGDLYLPDAYKDGDKLPAVVIAGVWMTVKEQMPAVYAKAMADRGFAALTFDFRGWGETGGSPRYLESPTRKISDIAAAADFLASRPEVDAKNINGIGICASAGYMAEATARDSNLKSVALIAPWLHDPAIVETVYGGQEGVAKLIDTSRAAAKSQEEGKPRWVPAASSTDKNAVMYQVPYYTEQHRGLIPQWDNQFNLASWEEWLTFDGVRVADDLRKPTLIVHSEAAAIPQGAKQFYAKLNAPKKEVWLDNVSQLDFYDRKDAVSQSADAAARHFQSVR